MLLFLDMLTTAAILFVVAVGLLAIFGVLKIINFAHGAWLTISPMRRCRRKDGSSIRGRVCRSPSSRGASPGGIAELFIIRPLYRRPLDAILATWGLGIVIGQLITLAFGRDVQLIPNLMSGTVRVLSVDYSVYRLFMLFAALAALSSCLRSSARDSASRPAR
jgi:branched-chain amino acid transport system permease protein